MQSPHEQEVRWYFDDRVLPSKRVTPESNNSGTGGLIASLVGLSFSALLMFVLFRIQLTHLPSVNAAGNPTPLVNGFISSVQVLIFVSLGLPTLIINMLSLLFNLLNWREQRNKHSAHGAWISAISCIPFVLCVILFFCVY